MNPSLQWGGLEEGGGATSCPPYHHFLSCTPPGYTSFERFRLRIASSYRAPDCLTLKSSGLPHPIKSSGPAILLLSRPSHKQRSSMPKLWAEVRDAYREKKIFTLWLTWVRRRTPCRSSSWSAWRPPCRVWGSPSTSVTIKKEKRNRAEVCNVFFTFAWVKAVEDFNNSETA